MNDTIASYTDGIIVEKSNIIINGSNHTIYGYSDGCGVYLKEVRNVTIKDLRIENFKFGAFLYAASQCKFYGNTLINNTQYGLGIQSSSNVTVSNNVIAENTNYGISIWGHSQDIFLKRNKIIKSDLAGILISNSISVIISKNDVSENVDGILLYNATNNMIIENNITRNKHSGIEIVLASSGNKIYHNNFINNSFHATTFYGPINAWDDGYPSGETIGATTRVLIRKADLTKTCPEAMV
ncbi:MAG: NosD domain-containing protein [Candidatus Bathyarchaeia archaeon]